ncbi:MAG: DUF2851 family protein [Schleiferiaceae bacterium]|nr:DUF2851 family protein [Schleiferiaceae bacterium]
MHEDYLQYLWKNQKFKQDALQTIRGEPIAVYQRGFHNQDAGPDFLEAQVRIADQLWAGQVEVHLRSSDWEKHGHQKDPAYNNVILHVVYEHDREIQTENGLCPPTLALKDRIDEHPYWRYEQLMQNTEAIPCARQIGSINEFTLYQMLERALVERFQERSGRLRELLAYHQGDWQRVFYRWMAYGFGLKVNAEPMLMWSRLLTQSVLQRLGNDEVATEAVGLGLAGLLADSSDAYGQKLQKEYLFHKAKHRWTEMKASQWRYARLRPPSFPELRLVQFIALFRTYPGLISQVLETHSVKELRKLLRQAQPASYWRQHYRLAKPTSDHQAGMGRSTADNLIINVIAPFAFEYGRAKDLEKYQQVAFDWLDQLGPENNRITRVYRDMSFPQESAFHTQGLYQLYKRYCSPKKCLSCGIGTKLLAQAE